MFVQYIPARLRHVGGARVDLGPVSLHHDPTIWLLVVADAHHIDGALQSHDPAGEGQRGAPLAGSRLGCEAFYSLLAVVVGLRDGGVRLMAPGGRAALVLIVDVGRGVEKALEAPGPQERRRTPEAVDLPYLIRDGNVGLASDLLVDDGLGKDRGERLGADRIARRRVQRRVQPERQIRDDVVAALRQGLLVEQELRGLHVENLLFYACQLVSTSAYSFSLRRVSRDSEPCPLSCFEGCGRFKRRGARPKRPLSSGRRRGGS